MLNPDDFIKRLEFIMEHYGLSASSFADKISVQRSSISHLLSGRNKPSLDFILKILDVFPELNVYWILKGTGHYLKNEPQEILVEKTDNAPTPILETKKTESPFSSEIENTNDSTKENVLSTHAVISQNNGEKIIDKIVFFYTDGTFYDYKSTVQK